MFRVPESGLRRRHPLTDRLTELSIEGQVPLRLDVAPVPGRETDPHIIDCVVRLVRDGRHLGISAGRTELDQRLPGQAERDGVCADCAAVLGAGISTCTADGTGASCHRASEPRLGPCSGCTSRVASGLFRMP